MPTTINKNAKSKDDFITNVLKMMLVLNVYS